MSQQKKIKRVAAIHDLSAFGRCALTVVIPTLSAMGVQVIPLPTALMSTHTGGFTDIYAMDLTESMQKMYSHWEQLGVTFDAIYSGFVLGSEQCDIIADFRRRFATGDCIVLTDPVFGDDGELYSTCTPEIAGKMRTLCAGSHIITPNLTEACALCGVPFEDTAKMAAKELEEFISSLLYRLADLGVDRVAITGIPVTKGEKPTVTTAAIDLSTSSLDRAPFYVSLPRLDARYHGTGELFASVLLGRLLNGYAFSATVSAASAFVRDVIDYSTKYDTPIREGIALEPCLGKLMK
ncbi:MAG: pyridoxamine kinase [Clostridia bacterium]|nr:pyridoxamine kinase [Clostridia bacterium]